VPHDDLDRLLNRCDRGKDGEEAVRLALDREPRRGDESTKDCLAQGPAVIAFLRLLDESGLLPVGRTLWVERLENFVKGMEEHAVESMVE
jgi:hypothetical protein